jgi:hypothetical protein
VAHRPGGASEDEPGQARGADGGERDRGRRGEWRRERLGGAAAEKDGKASEGDGQQGETAAGKPRRRRRPAPRRRQGRTDEGCGCAGGGQGRRDGAAEPRQREEERRTERNHRAAGSEHMHPRGALIACDDRMHRTEIGVRQAAQAGDPVDGSQPAARPSPRQAGHLGEQAGERRQQHQGCQFGSFHPRPPGRHSCGRQVRRAEHMVPYGT